ncbi:CooT family nickel-binding protein [Candidatus Bipolaricaulota bacterium]|nr:CooT family nickel-binding protein [Candidatus Bipolaricaulota bacterium]
MCLSKVFREKNEDEELLLEEISSVEVEDGKLLFTTIMGEEKRIEGTIKSIDFMDNRILMEKQ